MPVWLIGASLHSEVYALCDPFGVDVPLNIDITHSLYPSVR